MTNDEYKLGIHTHTHLMTTAIYFEHIISILFYTVQHSNYLCMIYFK